MRNTFLYLTSFLIINFINCSIAYSQTYWVDYTMGSKYFGDGDYDKAIETLEKAKIGALKKVGKKNLDYAAILITLAKSYEKKGKTKTAEPLYMNYCNIWKMQFGAEHYNYATTLISLGMFYQNSNRFKEAETTYFRARDIYVKSLGKKHTYYAASLQAIGLLYTKLERYDEALPLLENVLTLRKENEGEKHIYYNDALNNLAALYITKKLYAKALPLYVKAVEYQKNQKGENEAKYVESLLKLAETHQLLNKYEHAEPIFQKALKVSTENFGVEHPNSIQSLNKLALFYFGTGAYEKAEKYYQELIEIRKKKFGDQDPYYAGSLISLATLYQNMGRYTDAESLYLEGLKILKRKFGENNLDYAKTLNYIGVLYQYLGRFEEAGVMLEKSLQIHLDKLGKNHIEFADATRTIAGYYWASEQFKLAEASFQKAISIYKSQLGENNLDYAHTVGGLASFYLSMKRFTEAEPLLNKTFNIKIEKLGKDHPSHADSYHELGRLYLGLNKIDLAEEYHLKALEQRKKIFNEHNILYITSLRNLATFYQDINQYDKAEQFFMQVNKLHLQQINIFFSTLSENEKKKYWENYIFQNDIFNSFINKRIKKNPSITKEAYNKILTTKAILLNTSTKIKNTILNSKDSTIIKEYEQWKEKRDLMIKAYNLSNKERKEMGLDIEQIKKEINTIEKSLSIKSKPFSQLQNNPVYNFKDVKAKLNNEEAAIEIVRFRWYNQQWTDSVFYAAYIVKATSEYPEVVFLENGKALESKLLKYYQNSIKFQIKDEYSYNSFWKKINDKLKGIEKVYLSPDGVYNQVNLNTLYNPFTEKYLLDEVEIHLVTNTKELIKQSNMLDQNANTAILCGRPAYKMENKIFQNVAKSADTTTGTTTFSRSASWLQGGKFEDLPGTEKEINNISEVLKNNRYEYQVMLKENALEGSLKKVQSPKIMHIATHGFFIPSYSHKHAIPQNNTSKIEKDKVEFRGFISRSSEAYIDPMLRSGIVLAGVTNFYDAKIKPDIDDGILTAYEATTLNLDQTDLVVLSACETGKGDIGNGEGVYGLQRGLIVAGAKTIMMSLWKVDDAATQELMTNFYNFWIKKKKNKREAFQKAQDKLKKKYPHPYYWGAFVMVGA